ncbi:MAG: EAL domain-containing protein, partial [Acidimicrobiia bacterium]|nr:EAL domain-containing protein [Acidimicrobiia bacterium]
GDPRDAETVRIALAKAVRRLPSVSAATVFTLSGEQVAEVASPGIEPRAVSPALLGSIALSEPGGYGDVFVSSTGHPRYQHVQPIYDGQDVVGLIAAECSLQQLLSVLQESWRLADTADIHMLRSLPDGSAQWISPPRFDESLWFTGRVPAADRESPAHRAIAGVAGVTSGRDYRGVDVIASTHKIESTGWGLVVKVDKAEALEPVYRLRKALLVAFLAAVGAVAAASLLLSRSIIGRIRRVTEAAAAISEGDFDRRLADSSRDELGRLAGAFDQMTVQLASDIRRRRSAEAQLAHRATHDELTGLPNRALANERLSEAINRTAQGRRYVAVLFCDLDQFKAVNDGLGHGVGDELLREVAKRLNSRVDPGDTLARFGGDEFVVVCPALGHPDDAAARADMIRSALLEPFNVPEQKQVTVRASVGSAVTDDPTMPPDVLIREADAAMYRAKELGRDRYVPADDAIRESASAGLSVLTDLRRALDREGLSLEYQPIVGLASGEIEGVEALVRWPHPERGLLAPGQFLDLAARHGLSGALDAWVLRTASMQLASWRYDYDLGATDVTIWVNVAPTSLADPTIVEAVQYALDLSGLPPRSLCLEVTEGSFEQGDDDSTRNLMGLADLGVRLALDDFGSGYSNLARLLTLPFDVVKLDRSFVKDVDVDARARSIVASMTRLATDLGMHTVGEGVERVSQRDELAILGVASAQGFWFARPAPASVVASQLSDDAFRKPLEIVLDQVDVALG